MLLIGCQKEEENAKANLKGKLKKIVYPNSLEPGAEYFYYNSDLMLSDYKMANSHMTVSFQESFKYSGNNIKEAINLDGGIIDKEEGNLNTRRFYYYDKNGMLDSMLHYSAYYSKPLLQKYYYKFNTKKQLTEVLQLNYNPTVVPDSIRYSYQYDSSGNITTTNFQSSSSPYDGRRSNGKSEYTYNNKPNPKQYLSYYYLYPEDYVTYISPNNQIRQIDYDQNNQRIFEYHIEFEYNTEGKPEKEKNTIDFQNGKVVVDRFWEKIYEYY
ncbi:hypothetical protein AHMF7605_01555 [Adhaeribacter arboris]|uniref:Uncharacterized protein n=1 Tax=Adhaeribacter arboris TaxID=2072846 RepID=A0A2T2YA31_9BACT|nr:hypothetical protein [Adhaeribacter arboris]PSR52298.1 hypothetical protein AHMF7605_01555 [Adhaeribacter arboris]